MDFGILLSKLLPLFVYPTGSGLLLCVIALLFVLFNWKKTAVLALLLAICIVGVAASPGTATKLGAWLEGMYAPTTAAEAPVADAIIVLGGSLGGIYAPRFETELKSNRLVHAARLYREARAPVVLAIGGNIFVQPDASPESVAARDVLVELGVDTYAVVTAGTSRNTWENATEARDVMRERGLRRALLVTSARHMPRAMAVFQSLGVDVLAQPTDFEVVEEKSPQVLGWIPSSRALLRTELCLKEALGFFVYRWRGWISEDFGYLPTLQGEI